MYDSVKDHVSRAGAWSFAFVFYPFRSRGVQIRADWKCFTGQQKTGKQSLFCNVKI